VLRIYRMLGVSVLTGDRRKVSIGMLSMLKRLVSIARFSRYYLTESGWIQSADCGESIDCSGDAIPWLTYPALDFLSLQDLSALEVLEFGSGNSTIWWSNKASKVTTIEHDISYYKKIRDLKLKNAKILLRSRFLGIYESAPLDLGSRYDVVVIDAVNRMACLETAFRVVKSDGVIIFDNSTRPEYLAARDRCKEVRFKAIDFLGPTAISPHKSCTTIFYRADNIFGI
jgi:hypothetical protein